LRAMGPIGVENLIATIGGATPSRDPLVLPAKLLVPRLDRSAQAKRHFAGVAHDQGVRVFLEDGAVEVTRSR
jgi:hypothetical protein